ncbi:hypothetical protein B0H14DRAFT_2362413, partial [Mycena olivaceomarginata]
QIKIIQALISEGAAINYFEPRLTNSTPLAFAAIGNRIESMRFLLASGAGPNLHDGEFIPLMATIRSRNVDIARALVDAGADVHV